MFSHYTPIANGLQFEYNVAGHLSFVPWKEEQRPIRLLYQGILQIGVGYFHIRQGNWRGAVKVIERGIPKAARFRPICQGIDVEDLVTQAQAIHAELLELGSERIREFERDEFPRIKLTG